MLNDKKIVLGVTGSIAAYKAAHLTRLLVRLKADVKIIMTPSAKQFITPVTLSTISKNPVYIKFVNQTSGDWNNHVALGRWADIILIAPASANTLAKMAHGQCDHFLLATYLSAICPVFVAPAMDLDMWQHPATQHNIKRLKDHRVFCLGPTYGELASGITGMGRMIEPEDIIKSLENFFSKKKKRFEGKKALVTAGPTHEAIDPVRFIGNEASGKMGFAIAEALAHEGAHVVLVSGPTSCVTSHPNIQVQCVTSAQDMLDACMPVFSQSDIAIFSAAVADYQPSLKVHSKTKKQNEKMTLELTKTPDVAATLGKMKKKGQFTVGFALETENGEWHAKKKIQTKNFDLIALNSLHDDGAGFGYDTNKISLIDKSGKVFPFKLKSKQKVALDILEAIAQRYV